MRHRPSMLFVSVLLSGCMSAVSRDYVAFNKVQPTETQKALHSTAGLVLDSIQANSRVAIAIVSPKSLKGYGTPVALVVANRGKRLIMVNEEDISLKQDGGNPKLVTVARAIDIDNAYRSSHIGGGMVMALLGGALLAVAHTTDSASVNSIAQPLSNDVDHAEKTAKDRSAAFIKYRFRGAAISPGEVTTGYIVIENVKTAPLVLSVKVGAEVHQFTLLTKE